MSNDYFIPFLNLCVKTLNDIHFETERVVFIKKINNVFLLLKLICTIFNTYFH